MITQLVACYIIIILNVMIPIYISKQQGFDTDAKPIKQINFTANLDQVGQTTMFFIIEETKEQVLNLSQGTVRVL